VRISSLPSENLRESLWEDILLLFRTVHAELEEAGKGKPKGKKTMNEKRGVGGCGPGLHPRRVFAKAMADKQGVAYKD